MPGSTFPSYSFGIGVGSLSCVPGCATLNRDHNLSGLSYSVCVKSRGKGVLNVFNLSQLQVWESVKYYSNKWVSACDFWLFPRSLSFLPSFPPSSLLLTCSRVSEDGFWLKWQAQCNASHFLTVWTWETRHMWDSLCPSAEWISESLPLGGVVGISCRVCAAHGVAVLTVISTLPHRIVRRLKHSCFLEDTI